MLFIIGSLGIGCAVGWLSMLVCAAPASIWNAAGLCALIVVALCAIELDAAPWLIAGAIVGFASIHQFTQSIAARLPHEHSEESK